MAGILSRAILLATVVVVGLRAQPAADIGARLLQDAAVRAALAAARAGDSRTIEDQIRLCEIPAPPFQEAARARVFADEFRALGLANVRIDKEG